MHLSGLFGGGDHDNSNGFWIGGHGVVHNGFWIAGFEGYSFYFILIYWFSLTNDDASNGSQLALLPNDMNWILWWAFCVVGL